MKQLYLEGILGGTNGFEPTGEPKIIDMGGYFNSSDKAHSDALKNGIRKKAPKDAVAYILGDLVITGKSRIQMNEYKAVQFYKNSK